MSAAANSLLRSDDDRELRHRLAESEAALSLARAKLAKTEDKLNKVLMASQTWLFETGPDLRFTHIVGRLGAMTDLDTARLIGKTFDDLVVDRDDPKVERVLADIRAQKSFRDFVFQVHTADGSHFIRASGKPHRDADDEFTGYRGMGGDVTAQTEANLRAMATHRQLAEAIENIPASLMLFDAEDRIVICNSITKRYFPGAKHLLVPGTPFEDLLRADISSGSVWENNGTVEQWVAKRMKAHRSPGRVLTGLRSDGRWIQVTERRTSDGGTIGIRLDITKLKRTEEELRRKAVELEEYATELKRSNAELEQFAYVASHDLQEPLRMVASYCQLLQRRYGDKLDQDAIEFIGYAVDGATRMQRLVKDLLAFSHVGRHGHSFETLDMNDLLESTLANLQGAIIDSEAKVELGRLPRITGERVQLTQLFQNLIGNAIKFRRADAPLVRIEAGEPTDGFVQFTVEDNGIGIESEYLERVFLIFQRLHEREKYPGTGIGLAIVKKVIEYHGGHIWIESTPGQGSRFQFTLPVAKEIG
ncbi:MAG TPA: ATP-binding protein [Stellaceae bacterium]|jgi:signal transduction histidine kinase|nr:ATP-binding protein [Stellaceae bacterium]